MKEIFNVHGLDAVLYKEIRHIVRDPATLVLAVLMPLLQLIIFGYAINLHVEHVRSVYYSEDRGRQAEDVVDALRSSRSFDIVARMDSRAALERAITAGTAHVGFVLPENFSADVLRGKSAQIQVLIDGADSGIAQEAYGAAAQIGAAIAQRLSPASRQARRSVLDAVQSVEVRPRMLFNPALRSANFLIPGLVGLVLQNITMMLTALSIVGEREKGTLDQLLVTPISSTAIILGKLIPHGILGLLDFILVLAAMRFLFLVPIAGNLLLLFVLGFGFLLTALGQGLLVSTYARSQLQAILAASFLLMPAVLLSGVIFERELMPPVIQLIGYTIPLTYFLQILRGIIVRGAGIQDLWAPALATFVFGIVVISLASIRFNSKTR